MDKWQRAQGKELAWWSWYFGEHISLDTRPQMEGYRLCEGRYMMQHCGIPQGGLTPQEITGELLDIGCGAISVWENRAGVEVTAIDPLLPQMLEHPLLEKYAKLGISGNTLYLGQSVETIGFGGKFDWVWNYNVLDHTVEWKTHLAHCKRVLKPGGALLLGTDVRAPEYAFGEHDDEREMHPGIFTAEEVLQELDKIGLKVEWNRPLLPQKKFRLGLRARK